MKTSVEGLKDRLDQAEKRKSELEDRTMEIIVTEEQKEKILKKC